jgi:hypothetical protein
MTIKMLRTLVLCSLFSAACSFGAVDAGLLALVPQNSQFVVGVNVIASRNSDFGQYLSTQINADAKGLEQLDALTGFDPRRDLESVVIAGVAGSSGKQHLPGVLLARGTFDQSKIKSAAIAKGAVVQTLSGVEMYLQPNGRGKNAFAFLDSNVFATGSLAALQQTIANRLTPSPLDPKLQALIAQASADNDFWFASVVPASQFAGHLQPEAGQPAGDFTQVLQAITSTSGGIRFGRDIQITVDAIARSDKDASALVDVCKFGASMLQMKAPADPKVALLTSALNRMLVSASGQNVHLLLSLPETTLEQLADARSHRHLAH